MLTITLNAALDLTYRIAGLRPGESHRVTSVHAQAGGKGINVARVLAAIGQPVTVTGLVAGPTGAEIRHELVTAGLRDELVEVEGQSRRSVAVVDGDDATVFNEPGDGLRFDWSDAVSRLEALIEPGATVVASGSLPAAAPHTAYAYLVQAVHDRGGKIIVDTSGPALLEAAAAGADLLKPNAEEVLAATGQGDVIAAATHLLTLGAGAVAVSLGADGLTIVRADEVVTARPARFVHGNPTGAGDAAVAALALALADDLPMGEAARRSVALSAAAVAHPFAGHIDARVHRELLANQTDEGEPDDAQHHR
jgi:tagatose 6-phosphate kinase